MRRPASVPQSFLLLLLSCLPAFAGCSCESDPPTGLCESNDDCDDGTVCVDGVCQMEVVPGEDAGRPGEDAGRRDAGEERVCLDVDRDGHEGRTAACPEGTDCDDSSGSIGPDAPEVCGNGIDDDCDGERDEADCSCRRGERIVCYTGEAGTRGVGLCRAGIAVCTSPGEVTACRGETVPVEETCDREDNDCDGEVDEGLRNACGECAPERLELCGDEVDNDCDGMADEDCDCDYRCGCDEDDAFCECRPPTDQPCYEGPFGTEGRGMCAGGRRDCVVDAATGDTAWGACEGQVLPGIECVEGVANSRDDDCDGLVDEGCGDADMDGSSWPDDCDDTDPTVSPDAEEICDGKDNNCNGVADEGVTNGCGGCWMPAASDTCGNGLDDDCDGDVDEGCECTAGETQTCYGGPDGTAGVAHCRTGTQTCIGMEFAEWSACEGMVLPDPEVCDGEDNDCDGMVDERWAAGSNPCGFCEGTEVCDGEDNDCDGVVDEYLRGLCGACGPDPRETCNGFDDDCDGVVDEGVTNACGTCPPEPCFTETWDEPADCDSDPGRECDAVEEHPDFPGSITLGEGASSLPFIYIAVTARNEVAQLNTDTGVKNWQVSSHGRWPSRTAVAFDGSVWVGNRAMTASNPLDPAQSNVVHLDVDDGSLICRADVTGIARAVAIDARGDVWAGTFNGMQVWHISGTEIDDTMDPPRCVIRAVYDVGVNVYGITVDPDGFAWTSSSPTIRIDTRDGTRTTVTNPSHYGVAPDGRGQIWFGGWRGSGTVHAVRSGDFSILNTTMDQVTAVTVHPDGNVWGSRYGTNQIVSVDGITGAMRCIAPIPSGTNPHGVAVDRLGRIWTPSRFGSGTVNVFDTDCGHVATYTVDPAQELYSYSDMTGHLLRTFVAPEGRWIHTFDSGYEDPYWNAVEWDSDVPPDTGVEVTVRGSDDRLDFSGAVPCGPFTTSPADLTGCADLDGRRYLQVVVRLFSTSSSARPIVHEVRAIWAY